MLYASLFISSILTSLLLSSVMPGFYKRVRENEKKMNEIATSQKEVYFEKILYNFFISASLLLVIITVLFALIPTISESLGFNQTTSLIILTVISTFDSVTVYFLSLRINYSKESFVIGLPYRTYNYKIDDVIKVSGKANKLIHTKDGHKFMIFNAFYGKESFVNFLLSHMELNREIGNSDEYE